MLLIFSKCRIRIYDINFSDFTISIARCCVFSYSEWRICNSIVNFYSLIVWISLSVVFYVRLILSYSETTCDHELKLPDIIGCRMLVEKGLVICILHLKIEFMDSKLWVLTSHSLDPEMIGKWIINLNASSWIWYRACSISKDLISQSSSAKITAQEFVELYKSLSTIYLLFMLFS